MQHDLFKSQGPLRVHACVGGHARRWLHMRALLASFANAVATLSSDLGGAPRRCACARPCPTASTSARSAGRGGRTWSG